MRLIFVFIDGVGLGKEQPNNPFFNTKTPAILKLLDGKKLTEESISTCSSKASLLGLDAIMGVPGLPQSATGQSSIFTGINAASFMGRHINGFPDQKLRKMLALKGIFKRLRGRGYRVAFANAYRPPFFDLLRRGLPGNRYSCSTLITYYGGLPFYGIEDLETGQALFMDITNDILQRMGFTIPLISPEEGAERLIAISNSFDFCLFEYFLSDLAGHMADPSEAERVITILDRFIGKIADLINPEETMLVVTSDHGNLEDLASRDHTLNKVPALLVGDQDLRKALNFGLDDLTDLLPAVQTILGWNPSQ